MEYVALFCLGYIYVFCDVGGRWWLVGSIGCYVCGCWHWYKLQGERGRERHLLCIAYFLITFIKLLFVTLLTLPITYRSGRERQVSLGLIIEARNNVESFQKPLL